VERFVERYDGAAVTVVANADRVLAVLTPGHGEGLRGDAARRIATEHDTSRATTDSEG
jgi:hypothetical protein